MRHHLLVRVAGVAAVLALATSAFANSEYRATVNISPSNVTPPPAGGPTGSGSAQISINTIANTLAYNITYGGMTSAETAAHIHGFAAPGVNAGVLHGLPATLGTKVGTWNYTQAQEANILAGLTYINIHTTTNPGGEMRGQIVPTEDLPAASNWTLALLGLGVLGTAAFAARRAVRA